MVQKKLRNRLISQKKERVTRQFATGDHSKGVNFTTCTILRRWQALHVEQRSFHFWILGFSKLQTVTSQFNGQLVSSNARKINQSGHQKQLCVKQLQGAFHLIGSDLKNSLRCAQRNLKAKIKWSSSKTSIFAVDNIVQ